MVVAFAGPGVDRRCVAWGASAGVDVDLREPEPDLPAGLADVGADIAGATLAGVLIAPGAGGFVSGRLARAVGDVTDAGLPVVAVEPENLRRDGVDPAATPVARAGARLLYGRGPEVARYAVDHLARRAEWPPTTLAYRPSGGPDHEGDLRIPEGAGPHPVAVLLHGGFWYHAWERDLMDGLAVDLARRGWASWNLEYRRVGAGGGWPVTGDDVAAGVDHLRILAGRHPLALDRIALVGHSAGGQLALRVAARPACGDTVRPRLVVGLAALADLEAARAEGVGGRSVERLVAAAPDPGAALRDASPVRHVPLGVAQVLVHVVDDDVVPPAQSGRYVAAAVAAGDTARLVEPAAGGHFALIDRRSAAWAAAAAALDEIRA